MHPSPCCGPRMWTRPARRARARAWALAASLAAASLAAQAPASSAGSGAAPAADPYLGRWLTEPRDGIIEIEAVADGTYTGRIIGGDSPNRTDSHNPDPAKRAALLLGQVILKQLRYEAEGQWADGTIYDPDSGRTYHCSVQMPDPDRLKVRGFIGVSLLGRNQLWTRYRGAELTLPPAKH